MEDTAAKVPGIMQERLTVASDPSQQKIEYTEAGDPKSFEPARPPQLNSFQLKQHNEQIIARLMQTGLFQSKQHLLQAALMCLFADMQKAFKAAEAQHTLQAADAPTTNLHD